MAKKRRLRKEVKIVLAVLGGIFSLTLILLILNLFVFNNIHFLGVRSIQSDAKRYQTKSCLAFYPNTKDGKKVVEDLCSTVKEDETAIFDYALIPYGDYLLVEYGNGIQYFIDHNNNPLEVTEISDEGIKIVSDYLRYDMKKDEIDEAYTTDFIKNTRPENLDMDKCEYNVEGQNLLVYFPTYDYTTYIPLKYIQKEANINLGYENEKYVKPKYISPFRKTVAFTFDDGPNNETSSKIINTLYENDAVATFFIVGSRIDSSTIGLIKDSIEKGNQYGSHTQSHPNLTYLSDDEIVKEISQPAKDLYYGYKENTKYDFDGLGYTMTVYRAPGGNHNAAVDAVAPYMTIEWDCDTRDWASRDKDAIINEVHNFDNKNPDGLDGCIVLFHDIYGSTVEAIDVLVPELVNDGYQFVTIDELLSILDVDQTKACYPW